MATYKIEALRFRAIDESGIDWTGSDEPYFIFSTSLEQNPEAVSTVRSSEFGDVDSGDTRSFSPPIVLADNVPGGIALSVVVMEADAGDPSSVMPAVEKALKGAHWAAKIWGGGVPGEIDKKIVGYLKGWYEDDVLAQRTVTWAPWELAQGLPAVGSSVEEEVGYKGSANYTITYRASRVT